MSKTKDKGGRPKVGDGPINHYQFKAEMSEMELVMRLSEHKTVSEMVRVAIKRYLHELKRRKKRLNEEY